MKMLDPIKREFIDSDAYKPKEPVVVVFESGRPSYELRVKR